MIKPALQDDEFLADIRAVARERDQVHLWWLGQSGFLVQYQSRHLLLDPYLSDSLTAKYANTDKAHVRMSERVINPATLNFIDIVTSSHNHTDHLDADTIKPLLAVNPELKLVVPAANVDVAAQRLGVAASRLLGLADGESFEEITAVPAAHDQRERDEQGRDRYLGYIIRCGHTRIYHSGDTVRFEGMVQRLRRFGPIDLALLPINGKLGNMNGSEAARLAKDIGAKLVIPCHYDMFECNTADPRELFIPECERLGQHYRILRLGERFSSSQIPR